MNDPKPVAKNAACGLVMPISSLDGCSAEHWADVKSIVTEAVEGITDPRFVVRLVSDADEVGIIQKRIVQNLYNSDIVICDVSGKNPNVMFELGMRLAFDKPTIIIKDDKTEYSFDTSIIEHLGYPRDLRFAHIVAFKAQLADKVLAGYNKAKEDPEHSTFLKNFGKFHVASLQEGVISPEKLTLEMLSDLQSEVAALRRRLGSDDSRRIDSPAQLTIDLVEAIMKNVSDFRREHNISGPATNLVGNEDLYEFLESAVDARKRFVSRRHFIEAVDYTLRTRKLA
jgi:hypothetical protein